MTDAPREAARGRARLRVAARWMRRAGRGCQVDARGVAARWMRRARRGKVAAMLRLFVFACALASAACHGGGRPVSPTDELPPLPPASGTPVGYLLDSASNLGLDDTQIAELRKIDASLSVRNEQLDTQLREIERPEQAPPPDPKAPPAPPPNMAPGQQALHTTADSAKLHEARSANNKDGLERAFAVLTPPQQEAARTLLAERGITAPRAPAAGAKP